MSINFDKVASFLAPMQDVSDLPFMQIIASCGSPDVYMAEFFRIYKTFAFEKHILRAVQASPDNKPVVAQFIGEDVVHISRAMKELSALGVKYLDLNLGCPAPKIYKKKVGGGLLLDKHKISEILKVMRDEWGGCLSVKMRTGFENDDDFEDIFNTVASHKPDFISIHARTVKQLYRGQVNYSLIKKAVSLSDIPIIANGDISNYKKAKEIVDYTKCAGVMIGRSAIRNPWIFKQIRQYNNNESVFEPSLEDVRIYIDKLHKNALDYNLKVKKMDSRLKKFLNFIATGVDEEGNFLRELRLTIGIDNLLKVCDKHLVENDNASKKFAFDSFKNLCARPNCEL